ncbi:hypothetical protein Tco_0296297 [Tanacetum coccineum]
MSLNQQVSVGRCNNKTTLLNIPCSKECRIVGHILSDHVLSYALTATVDVPAIYIQQFYKTVKQVPNANESIRFMLDKKDIIYIILGYQGSLPRVSAFFVKNLAQPWQTLFKIFNICLTSRMIDHDQTKINVLQIFHAVVNKVHADYAKFIPKRLEEEYHTIKDDTPLVNIYTTGEVTVRGMQILDDLRTDEIKDTQTTPRATRTPNLDVVQKKKKGKQIAGESSTPKTSLKIRIKQKKPTLTTPLLPSDDRERDDIIEATQLIEKRILEEDIEKLVEGDDESSSSDFADTMLLKEIVDDEEKKDDDDEIDDKDDKDDNDDDDHNDQSLIKTQETGSSEIRTEKMQTPIPSPPRSIRTHLSSDKAIPEELTVSDIPMPDVPSYDPEQPTSSRHTHLRGIGIMEKVNETLREIVPELTTSTTNDIMKENLPRMVNDVVKKEKESSQAVEPALISQEFAAHAPKITEELFRIHMQNTILNIKSDLQSQVDDPELWNALKAKYEKSLASTDSCMYDAFRKHDHDDHPGDDAPHEGEKNAKRHKTSRNEVIPEDETPELLNEFQNVDKRVPTIYDHERMEATIKDMLSNQFRDVEEYAYHLEQAKNYIENQIVWKSRQEDLTRSKQDAPVLYGPQRNPNEPSRYLYKKDLFFLKNGNTEEKKYVLSLHKIHEILFPEEDLEEKMIR